MASSCLTCCGWLGRARDANLWERGLWEDSLKPVNGRIDLDGELWGWVAAGSMIADGSPCSHHEANGVQNGMTLELTSSTRCGTAGLLFGVAAAARM